jgi:hypothetical protein
MRAPEWRIQDENNSTVFESNSIDQDGRRDGGFLEKEPFELKVPRAKLPASGRFELLLTAKAWSTNQVFDFSVWFYHFEPRGK